MRIKVNFLILFCVCFFSIHAFSGEIKKRIDIAAYDPSFFWPESIIDYGKLREHYALEYTCDLYEYVRNFQKDTPNLHKIIFFDYCEDPKVLRLPRHKLICFKWEAKKIRPEFYIPYYKVYTFDDELVDGKKFFKFCYPVLKPMLSQIPSFCDKRMCVIIATNWTAERLQILDYFANNPHYDLDVYGKIQSPYEHYEIYKGPIEGSCLNTSKLHTLKKYRFCICFENTHSILGYITEKMFDAFAAGCVPIYWGPDNVQDYIPTDCFVDYRKFQNLQEMYQFIASMTESEYDLYIDRIRDFLQSEKAHLFSSDYFAKLLLDAVQN